MRSTSWLIVLAGTMMTLGCSTRARFEDVSAGVKYKSYIGKSYAVKVPMHLSGVNLPPGYRQVVNIYKVNPANPGWSGPEVITRDILPIGTMVVVESVHRCTNCFLDLEERLEARIRILGYRLPLQLPVAMPLEYLTPEFSESVQEPNKAPEPTPGLVTPRASARVAPSPGVAHL